MNCDSGEKANAHENCRAARLHLTVLFQRKLYSMELLHDSGSSLAMTISYLEKLNPQQRRAVEHGGSALAEAGPLLIIAGAGSGKTNTLAHRVAHLIVNGADPPGGATHRRERPGHDSHDRGAS